MTYILKYLEVRPDGNSYSIVEYTTERVPWVPRIGEVVEINSNIRGTVDRVVTHILHNSYEPKCTIRVHLRTW